MTETEKFSVYVLNERVRDDAHTVLGVFVDEALAVERARELIEFHGGKRQFEVQSWPTDGTLHGQDLVFTAAASRNA